MAEKDTLRPEYQRSDLEMGERGRYKARYDAGTNLIRLDPDIAAHFPTSEAVNKALRSLVETSEE